MKISISATNPCHVYDLALALHEEGNEGLYYSGYPRWRLRPPPGFPIETHAARTIATYALLRMPRRMRPDDFTLFRWQDEGFDAQVADALEPADFIHGLPGQCEDTFRRARDLGIRTVLNHASGPVEIQAQLMAPEYRRAGYPYNPGSRLNVDLHERVRREIELADFHCAASTVVRDQLRQTGVPADSIWVVPYGADADRFPKSENQPDRYRICFAGQLSLRKGIYYLLRALETGGSSDWELNCYGPGSPETEVDFRSYRGAPRVHRHGPVPQAALAPIFHKHAVLVLPSCEEAFGLVVVQALQSGLPCIVSDRVGAGDLIRHRENGSIFPFGDTEALLKELRWWEANPARVTADYPWSEPAQRLIRISQETMNAAPAKPRKP